MTSGSRFPASSPPARRSRAADMVLKSPHSPWPRSSCWAACRGSPRSAAASLSAFATRRAAVSSRFTTLWVDGSYTPPTSIGDGKVRVAFGLDTDVKLAGVAGPSLYGALFGELTVNPWTAGPWWTLDGGATVEIGFDIDVWFANVSYTLGAIDLFRVNLAQSAGPWPGPRLVDTDLPEGYVNQPYDIAIDYSGGDPPLTLSITYGPCRRVCRSAATTSSARQRPQRPDVAVHLKRCRTLGVSGQPHVDPAIWPPPPCREHARCGPHRRPAVQRDAAGDRRKSALHLAGHRVARTPDRGQHRHHHLDTDWDRALPERCHRDRRDGDESSDESTSWSAGRFPTQNSSPSLRVGIRATLMRSTPWLAATVATSTSAPRPPTRSRPPAPSPIRFTSATGSSRR